MGFTFLPVRGQRPGGLIHGSLRLEPAGAHGITRSFWGDVYLSSLSSPFFGFLITDDMIPPDFW